MKRAAFVVALLVLSALDCHSGSGDCVAAGGSCRIGPCPTGATDLPHDCNNGSITPGGQSCCTATADACPRTGCTVLCIDFSARNVSTIVNGCEVWQCCVHVDAGGDASSDAGDAAE